MGCSRRPVADAVPPGGCVTQGSDHRGRARSREGPLETSARQVFSLHGMGAEVMSEIGGKESHLGQSATKTKQGVRVADRRGAETAQPDRPGCRFPSGWPCDFGKGTGISGSLTHQGSSPKKEEGVYKTHRILQKKRNLWLVIDRTKKYAGYEGE